MQDSLSVLRAGFLGFSPYPGLLLEVKGTFFAPKPRNFLMVLYTLYFAVSFFKGSPMGTDPIILLQLLSLVLRMEGWAGWGS